jgi:DNA-directed RNA polymerase specialized sigma24 family protein
MALPLAAMTDELDWEGLSTFSQHLIGPLARRFGLRREDAADAVSDALLAVWERREFVVAPGTGYLARTAYRKALDMVRRGWRRRAIVFTDYFVRETDDGTAQVIDLPDLGDDPAEQVVRDLHRAAMVEAVQAVLADLPSDTAALLREGYGGIGLAAMARRDGIPAGTITGRARRAQQAFRTQWHMRYGALEGVPDATDDY